MKEDLDSKVNSEIKYSLPLSHKEKALEDEYRGLMDKANALGLTKLVMEERNKALIEFKTEYKHNGLEYREKMLRYIVEKCSKFLESYIILENDFNKLRKTAGRLGILNQLYNIEDKALSDSNLKNKHNDNADYLESRRYAFKECDKFIEEQFKYKETDEFIRSEKEFRKKQVRLF